MRILLKILALSFFVAPAYAWERQSCRMDCDHLAQDRAWLTCLDLCLEAKKRDGGRKGDNGNPDCRKEDCGQGGGSGSDPDGSGRDDDSRGGGSGSDPDGSGGSGEF